MSQHLLSFDVLLDRTISISISILGRERRLEVYNRLPDDGIESTGFNGTIFVNFS